MKKFEIGKMYYTYGIGYEYFVVVDKSDAKITYKTGGMTKTVPLYVDDSCEYFYFYNRKRTSPFRVAIAVDGMVKPLTYEEV